MKKAVMVIVTLLLIPIVYSCPPSFPESVYMKEVRVSTDAFIFLEPNLDPVDFNTNQAFPPKYFDVRNTAERLIILANEKEVSNTAIAELRFERYLYDYDTETGRDVIVYNFPGDEFENNDLNNVNQLKHLENARVQIYLDENMVGEYILGRHEAQIKNCPTIGGNSFEDNTSNLIYIISSIIAISVIAFILLKRRR